MSNNIDLFSYQNYAIVNFFYVKKYMYRKKGFLGVENFLRKKFFIFIQNPKFFLRQKIFFVWT